MSFCVYVVDLDIQFQNGTYTVDESDSILDVLITLEASIERDVVLDLVTIDGRATAGTRINSSSYSSSHSDFDLELGYDIV